MFLIRFFETSGGFSSPKRKARCESLLDIAAIAIVILTKFDIGKSDFFFLHKIETETNSMKIFCITFPPLFDSTR